MSKKYDENLLALLKWARKSETILMDLREKLFKLKDSDKNRQKVLTINAFVDALRDCRKIKDPDIGMKMFLRGAVWARPEQDDGIPFHRDSLIQFLIDTGVCKNIDETAKIRILIKECIDEHIILEASNGMLGVPEKVPGSIGYD